MYCWNEIDHETCMEITKRFTCHLGSVCPQFTIQPVYPKLFGFVSCLNHHQPILMSSTGGSLYIFNKPYPRSNDPPVRMNQIPLNDIPLLSNSSLPFVKRQFGSMSFHIKPMQNLPQLEMSWTYVEILSTWHTSLKPVWETWISWHMSAILCFD